MNANKISLLVCLTTLVAQTLSAGTINVTTTADAGPGSLRNALAIAANGDTIDATGVSGTILLTSGDLAVANNVNITGPGPASLTIDGHPSLNIFRVIFRVHSNSVASISGFSFTNGNPAISSRDATLSVSNCLFQGNNGGILNVNSPSAIARVSVVNSVFNGNTLDNGGAVINDAALLSGQAIAEFVNCKFEHNLAVFGGAIYNSGNLTLRHCVLSENIADSGGAIGNAAKMTIEDSVLRNNLSDFYGGGGIFNYGELTFVNSTLSSNVTYIGWTAGFGNRDSYGGGAIYNAGNVSPAAQVRILNSTLSDNLATFSESITPVEGGVFPIYGGAIYNDSAGGTGRVQIVNSTLAGNLVSYTPASGSNVYVLRGGAIYNSAAGGGSAVVELNHSTVAGNYAETGGGIYTEGTLTLSNSILAGNGASTAPNLFGTSSGDFNFIGGHPLLGPLQDNGGPTRTMALLPGSPCINAGDPNFAALPQFDQRGPGFARVANGRLDIGAFEVQSTDSDGDGVPDALDQCPNTPPGAIVDAAGCSLAQLVPCSGPRTGGHWKNHGEYVSAIAQTSAEFLQTGLITRNQRTQIVTDAAHSRCGQSGGAK